jgi:hypothetical protein
VKLPNADHAIIPIEKLSGYCLDEEHEHGQHKAYLFSRLLGINRDNLDDLRVLLEVAVRDNEVAASKNTEHGTIYYIDSEVVRTERIFILRSLWIILNGEIIPRFVSCYVRRKGAKHNAS